MSAPGTVPGTLPLAVLQCQGHPGDPAANLALLAARCREAAMAGDRLLVTPELFLTGFHIGARVRALACALDSPQVRGVCALAGRHRVALCVGFAERDGDSVYNAALVVGPSGRLIGCYRKHRLSGPYENGVFQRGSGDDLRFGLDGVRVGVLVCYDMEFPENVRRLALAGIQLIVVPTALAREWAIVADKLVPTRAFENGVFMAYADRCGREGSTAYAGRSCIVAPDGRDLARAGDRDTVLRARIVPRDYAAVRRRLPYLRDLRAG